MAEYAVRFANLLRLMIPGTPVGGMVLKETRLVVGEYTIFVRIYSVRSN